eukprot:scaffold18928_cov69-Phaeocystis_antarctica.AAC.10
MYSRNSLRSTLPPPSTSISAIISAETPCSTKAATARSTSTSITTRTSLAACSAKTPTAGSTKNRKAGRASTEGLRSPKPTEEQFTIAKYNESTSPHPSTAAPSTAPMSTMPSMLHAAEVACERCRCCVARTEDGTERGRHERHAEEDVENAEQLAAGRLRHNVAVTDGRQSDDAKVDRRAHVPAFEGGEQQCPDQEVPPDNGDGRAREGG